MSYGVADYVDPLIGTAEHGHVYPGATVPFGSVQLSPDNGTQGWDWCSGYNYDDSTIVGFSHTHLSGTGIGDLYDLLLMPADSRIDLSNPVSDIRKEAFASTFKHDNEVAQAGYYQVLLDNGINVQLTTTDRVGFHLYDYPEGLDPAIVLDLGYHINWDRPVDTELKQHTSSIYTGKRLSTGWAIDQRIYFAVGVFRSPQGH